MTELEKFKITVEINRLEEEAKKLEDMANGDADMFLSAWREYGSELAGPPQSIEINRNTAAGLRDKANFLRFVKDVEDYQESVVDLERKISQINQNIEKLNKEKVALYQKMSLRRYLDGVIG